MRKYASLYVLVPVIFIGISYLSTRPLFASLSHSTLATEQTSVLTAKDFDGNGLVTREVNPAQETFTLEVSPTMPPYVLHVFSRTPSYELGRIDIFSNRGMDVPLQTITLDPNMRLPEEVATFFNAADINFDGFLDIGVLVDGGASWGSYQYWVFNQQTGTFITSPITEDLRALAFNTITFDSVQKQIVIEDIRKKQTIYTFQNGRLHLGF